MSESNSDTNSNTNSNESTKLSEIWNENPNEFIKNGKKFDIDKFNKEFDENIKLTKRNNLINDINKLNKLSENVEKTELYDLTATDLIINAKNALFGFLDDLLDGQFVLSTLTKDNRLFYIGITIIFICLIMYVFLMLNEL
jgi:hypothetical protein